MEGGSLSHLTRGVEVSFAEFRSRRRQSWAGFGVESLGCRLYGELFKFGLNPVISR
jgi:hypothetical protein